MFTVSHVKAIKADLVFKFNRVALTKLVTKHVPVYLCFTLIGLSFRERIRVIILFSIKTDSKIRILRTASK